MYNKHFKKVKRATRLSTLHYFLYDVLKQLGSTELAGYGQVRIVERNDVIGC